MRYAQRNVTENNLKHRIRPLLTKPHDNLIPLDSFGFKEFVSLSESDTQSEVGTESTSLCATHHSMLPPQIF